MSMQTYNDLMKPAREQFEERWGEIETISAMMGSEVLELYLINFSAMGSRITEPVENWILRAAERCAEIGLADTSRALLAHAKAEAGHHLMMIRDVHKLVARWNASGRPALDADELLLRPMQPGAEQYCRIHEENIAGPAPYAQFAIEYEIEMLPVKYGQRFVEKCVGRLGTDILGCLEFLTEHVELDVGHTHFNSRQLEKLIVADPSRVPVLVSAGTAALEAYSAFLNDCMEATKSGPPVLQLAH